MIRSSLQINEVKSYIYIYIYMLLSRNDHNDARKLK